MSGRRELRTLERLLAGLQQYRVLLRSGQYQEAAQLRSQMNVLYGEVKSVIQRLGVPTEWEQFGRVFPTFEMALEPITGHLDTVIEAINHAIGSIETAVGLIKAEPKRLSSKIRQCLYPLSGAILLVLGWLFGRNWDPVWHWGVSQIALLKRLSVAQIVISSVAALGALFFGGLFVNQVHQHGLKGRKQFIYGTLCAVFVVFGVVISKWPAEPGEPIGDRTAVGRKPQTRTYPLGGSRSQFLTFDGGALTWQPLIGPLIANFDWRDLDGLGLRVDAIVSVRAAPGVPTPYAQIRVVDGITNAVLATSDPVFQTGSESRLVVLNVPRGTGPESLSLEVGGFGHIRAFVEAQLVQFPR